MTNPTKEENHMNTKQDDLTTAVEAFENIISFDGVTDEAFGRMWGEALAGRVLEKFKDLTDEEARTISAAAKPLWEAMASLGMVDGWGGCECKRVVPEAIAFIHREANS